MLGWLWGIFGVRAGFLSPAEGFSCDFFGQYTFCSSKIHHLKEKCICLCFKASIGAIVFVSHPHDFFPSE